LSRATELVVRFAVSRGGAALDAACVRHLGHSPVSWLFSRADGSAYNPPLLLETRGRKTGRWRPVVLPYFPGNPGRICVVGSRGGHPVDPHWARNLRADGRAQIHLDRAHIEVDARLLAGDERARFWEPITRRAPVYLTYQQRALGNREIPVFELARRDGRAFDSAVNHGREGSA
jgi:deazaflavin-dependent oxidoreductase (nitroreductase family)